MHRRGCWDDKKKKLSWEKHEEKWRIIKEILELMLKECREKAEREAKKK